MSDAHTFEATLRWPADASQKLPPDPAFSRDNVMAAPGKHEVAGSAPAVFSGDATRYNPEELMLMSLSECHMLTYLAIAGKKRMGILGYEDRASGTLAVGPTGKMQMTACVLRPVVTLPKGSNLADARAMHDKAHANCFMANSVNFPVTHEPVFIEV
ncbi:MAG: OsmC family protein [Betaproteobacteria bacterium]|nr:OsmC family protein [Betaproteobacteria bacterium]